MVTFTMTDRYFIDFWFRYRSKIMIIDTVKYIRIVTVFFF